MRALRATLTCLKIWRRYVVCAIPALDTEVLMHSQQEMILSTKVQKPTAETDKGVPLAPSEKDLKPWYSDKGKGRMLDDMDNDMRYAFKPRVVSTVGILTSHPPTQNSRHKSQIKCRPPHINKVTTSKLLPNSLFLTTEGLETSSRWIPNVGP